MKASGHLVEVVFDNPNSALKRLAAVIVDPPSLLIPVGEASKTVTLNLNRNCGRELLSGWVLNTWFCVISHAVKILCARCRLQVTALGVFPYQCFIGVYIPNTCR